MTSIKARIQTLRIKFYSELLDELTISKSPFIQFQKWIRHSFEAKISEPNAMTLATITDEGYADARIVLLRDFSSKGFTFFTNYNSIKGREIRQNKKVCINFFWSDLHRQVRIRGIIKKTSARVSDSYFTSRPRASQLGAWTSDQSAELINRKELENRYKAYEKKFKGRKIPRPLHWGGYIVKPVYFEFWQGQTNRMHDRIIYKRMLNGKWKIARLNP